MSSDAKTVILSTLRATGGAIAAKFLLERLGWALAPSNEPRGEALTPLQRLRNVMEDLEYLDQVKRIGDTWQALDRWGKPIPKARTVRIVATCTSMPSELAMSTERPDDAARRKAREDAAASKEKASRRVRGSHAFPEVMAENKESVIRILLDGGAIPAAAKAVNVSEWTVRYWMTRDHQFRDRVKQILRDAPRKPGKPSSMSPEVESVVREKVAAGWGFTAISYLLKVSPSKARGYVQQVKTQTGSNTSSIRA